MNSLYQRYVGCMHCDDKELYLVKTDDPKEPFTISHKIENATQFNSKRSAWDSLMKCKKMFDSSANLCDVFDQYSLKTVDIDTKTKNLV